MTENEAVREMTFEEEYEILQKEKKELFSMEDENSETPFANYVVRRALRCIRKLLEEIQQYRAIGTVEECQEAMEKQRAKRPSDYQIDDEYDSGYCPCCGKTVYDDGGGYCPYCGQMLEWGEEE